MPMLDCLFSGISAFRYLLMIFQHHMARITQSGFQQPSIDVQGVSRSTTSNMDVQGVSQSIACSVDVCISFHLCKIVCKMLECRPVRHPVSPVPEWTKCRCRNQSGTGIRGPSPVTEFSGTGLRYRMPSPSPSASMPMPSYAQCTYLNFSFF